MRATSKRRHGRLVVTVTATDPSGIRSIQFRLGKHGRWRTYRKPLVLRASQLKTLQVRATDRAGNVSRPLAVRAH